MQDSQTTTVDYELRRMKVSDIVIGRDNPRVIFPESADIKELADSIAASGVIEPVHVRRVGNDLCELIAGERRLMAAKTAGCEDIPVIDHGAIGDDETFEITFLENFGRKDLTVMEQSLAVAMCIKKFGSSEAVAEKLGKSVRWVVQRANIEKGLSDEWKKEIATCLPFTAWPASHIALIARLPAHIQEECIDDFSDDDSVITLIALETKLRERVKLLDKAPWDMDARGPDKKTPACIQCNNRSSVQPGLWDEPGEVARDDRCLDGGCWQEKFDGYLKGRLKELKDQYGKVICLAVGSGLHWRLIDRLRNAFGPFEYTRNFNMVKKQAGGRTAALIVYGTGVGELRWVKDKVSPSTKGKSGKVCDLLGHGPKPKPLKDRRKELDSKRWFKVLGEMFTAVTETKADDIVADDRTLFVTTAATVFASSLGHLYVTNDCFTKLKEKFAEWSAADAVPQLAADRELWEEVRTRIGEGLSYNGPITQVPKEKIAGAKIIAGYLGIDIGAMFGKQKKAIAEPKSWSKLKADGTPKAAAKKKKGRSVEV